MLYNREQTLLEHTAGDSLSLVAMEGGTAPCRPGLGGSEARGRREGERRREQSRRAGAGAIAPLSFVLADARGGRRAGARWRAGVGREGWGGSDVACFYWSTRRLK
jgi:hypothetical protein